MLTIGLCGQSGSGKGTICAILQNMGIPSVDTDQLYHAMISGPSPCTTALIEAFGPSISSETGGVDTKKLRTLVFSDPSEEAHRSLNRITHKYIKCEIRNCIEKYKKENALALVIDAPMLFESGADALCDLTVSVISSVANKQKRLIDRDHLSQEMIDLRLSHQLAEHDLLARCDYSLSNNGTLDELREAVELLFKIILKNN